MGPETAIIAAIRLNQTDFGTCSDISDCLCVCLVSGRRLAAANNAGQEENYQRDDCFHLPTPAREIERDKKITREKRCCQEDFCYKKRLFDVCHPPFDIFHLIEPISRAADALEKTVKIGKNQKCQTSNYPSVEHNRPGLAGMTCCLS
jgi:hypothetical protein